MDFIWSDKRACAEEDAKAVRTRVFVSEQGFSIECELDDIDNIALHLAGYDARHSAICAARIFTADGSSIYHAGRIAVDKSVRGQGMGRLLMNEIIAKVRCLGGSVIELDAQYDKAEFYEKCGFVRTGKDTVDEGYPHLGMRLTL